MRAAILAIGDEIVAGLTTDTNSGFLAQLLRGAGLEVVSGFAVPDDEDLIVQALRRALEDADVVVTTGGLGPTADDLTTACIARLAGVELELDGDSLAAIERRFRERGIEMSANNRKQAMFPVGSTILPNAQGTAPGFVLPLSGSTGAGLIASLPGVPREMRPMAEESLLPALAALGSVDHFASRVFSTFGLTESQLDERLAGVVEPNEARISFRAAFPRLQVRLTATAGTDAVALDRLDSLELRVRERLGDHVYAVGDEGMEETVGRLLRDRGLSVAAAESCTGGLIGHRLTDVPGSSDYFRLGVIAYSNDAKQALLGVSGETLRAHGAVSEATVLEMARGVRASAAASIGLATSGIAGPGGGTVEKPVGTVWIAIATSEDEWARRFDLGSRSRSWVKEMTAQIALDRLRRYLLEGGFADRDT